MSHFALISIPSRERCIVECRSRSAFLRHTLLSHYSFQRLDVRQHWKQRPKDGRRSKLCWHPDQRTASILIHSAPAVLLIVSKPPHRFGWTDKCTDTSRPIRPRTPTQYPRGPKRPDRATRPRGIDRLDCRRSSRG